MSEKEEDHIPIKVKDAEIIEQKPPNDKIIEFKIDYSDSIICPECNRKYVDGKEVSLEDNNKSSGRRSKPER